MLSLAMRRFVSSFTLVAVVAVAALAWSQDAAVKPNRADDHADWVQRGVLRTIPSVIDAGEVYTGPVELYELMKDSPALDYTPHYEAKTQTIFEQMKRVTLRRAVWNLELSFKPMRLIEVDVPQADGRMKKKLIWYLLYRVRNYGGHLQPEGKVAQSDTIQQKIIELEEDDQAKEMMKQELIRNQIYTTKKVDEFSKDTFPQVVFFPHFTLLSHEYDKEYVDRIIPSAVKAIEKRERIGKPLYDSVTISRQKIEVTTAEKDNSLWGVATWEDVDPRTDFFSVYVQGLTNAYQFTDDQAKYKAGDVPGSARKFARRTLILHFWRAGDSIDQNSKEIRYGMPNETNDVGAQSEINGKYGVKSRLDHRWEYR